MAEVLNFRAAQQRKQMRDGAEQAQSNPKVTVQVGRGHVLVYRDGERVLELTLGGR